MSLSRLVCLAIIFLTLGTSAANAQGSSDRRTFELTPFGGSRFGGLIDFNSGPSDFFAIRSTWDYGAWLDVDLVPHAQAEFMWNHQPTVLSAHDPATGTLSRVGQANLDMYQWGILYSFLRPESPVQPYFAGGLGFTHFNAHSGSMDFLPFANRFSYNMGLGVKYFPTRHLGLRLDARYSPTRTTSSNALFCDPFFGCFVARVPNYAQQGQVNLGVIFRF
ncbi:MAG TPA: outer membrane beta-barrel protein [Candidatus Acidoferrales bacterium]|nr:outer membrane beta-barrel protein [Candidatus Acidoferrales bacterium]